MQLNIRNRSRITVVVCGNKKLKNSKKVESKETPQPVPQPDKDIEEPLDLADLDLSRLRLSKKDLETLSSITPGLPKCFQEQLLAKLPPTQARKLSRTLSMQNSIHHPNVRVYKRSQSGGRNMIPLDIEGVSHMDTPNTIGKKTVDSDRSHSLVYRRSLSRSRYDYDNNTDVKHRSASVCRVSDDVSKSLCSSYSSDVSDKYKYYSPYLAKGRDSESSSVSPYKRYESISPKESGLSPSKDFNSRSSGECISPTTDVSGIHRRYSRFVRQEGNSCNLDENRSFTDKKIRERESQCGLREIKEKSRESSRDRLSQSMELEQFPDDGKKNPDTARHVRNKSLDISCDASTHSRHTSRCRETPDKTLQKEEIASKILAELQTLSATKTRKEKSEEISSSASKEVAPEKVVVKKVRKVKPKEKSLDSTSPDAGRTADTKTTVIKKVKKIVKRSETKGEEKNGNIPQESSTSKSDLEKPKKESKLKRPKSFPIKETDKITPSNPKSNTTETCVNETKTSITKVAVESSPENCVEAKEVRLIRPKSYPASKLTPPKDIKRIISSSPEKQTSDLVVKPTQKRSSLPEDSLSSTATATGKGSESLTPTEIKPSTGKKIIKVTRKSKITSPTLVPKTILDTESKSKDISPTITTVKEKSPEKKVGKGLLYAIGQKFEKLRDSAKGKEKKIATKATTSANAIPQKVSDDSKEKLSLLKKKKAKSTTECCHTENSEEKTEEKSQKSENRRSRIDAMIRSLRERSVPRTPIPTESTLIKRAVSVEEIPGAFNKCAVNRVLGLFKRFEKDGSDRKVRSTRSTSNIERQMHKSESPIQYAHDRPKSSGFLTKPSKNANILISKSEAANRFQNEANSIPKKKEILNSSELPAQPANAVNMCPDCHQDQQSPSGVMATEKEDKIAANISKDKRKALVLDFTKLDKIDNKLESTMRQNTSVNGNSIHNAAYYDTNSNNNNLKTSSNEINRNHIFSPPNDNATTYSSDSRSYHDDCASSSTFLSPTDEPELCFDNWSICSEDNYMLATPSPTVSRLSRTSHYSSPTHASDANESVIDRIKRRSFYSRFNEKRPKRQSSIVGPAARDYYRESSISSTNKPKQALERQSSPDITKEFFKPLKLSPAGSELKQPIYRSVDTSKPRRLDNLHSSTSPSFLLKRYTSDNDYLLGSSRLKSGSNTYDNNGPSQPTSYYNTYNPKRRSSYNLNGALAGTTATKHNVDGYATVGRRSTLRPYDHRTLSLLDPVGQSSSSVIGTYRRDYRTPINDIGSFSRSRSNYRSTSVTRSPTNI